MKSRNLISTLGLIVTVCAGSPQAMAAGTAKEGVAPPVSPVVDNSRGIPGEEAGQLQTRTPVNPARYELSLEEMDKVSAGAIAPFYSWLFDVCPDCVASLILDYGVNIYE